MSRRAGRDKGVVPFRIEYSIHTTQSRANGKTRGLKRGARDMRIAVNRAAAGLGHFSDARD